MKPFKCEACDRTFGFKDGLHRHVAMVHFQARPFGCPFCSIKFKTKAHLSKHSLALHPEEHMRSSPNLRFVWKIRMTMFNKIFKILNNPHSAMFLFTPLMQRCRYWSNEVYKFWLIFFQTAILFYLDPYSKGKRGNLNFAISYYQWNVTTHFLLVLTW